MKTASMMAVLCFLTACSGEHVFEVDTGGIAPKQATLTLYGRTMDMERVGTRILGRRRGSDGSGRILLTYDDGRSVECPIWYVTNGETEPHRFIVRNGSCEPNA